MKKLFTSLVVMAALSGPAIAYDCNSILQMLDMPSLIVDLKDIRLRSTLENGYLCAATTVERKEPHREFEITYRIEKTMEGKLTLEIIEGHKWGDK